MSSTSSTKKRTEREDLPPTVLVGRVRKPHGIRGEVTVEVLSDVPGRLDPGSSLLLADGEGEPLGMRPGLPARVEVVASRPHQGGLLVRFAGVEDRDAAAAFTGVWLAVERSRVPPPPDGSYYRYELIGCRCRDGGREIGRVVDVIEDGGGLLLIVEGKAEGRREGTKGETGDETRQVPIPFVESFIREIDVEAGEIALELPPGLVEACESTS